MGCEGKGRERGRETSLWQEQETEVIEDEVNRPE